MHVALDTQFAQGLKETGQDALRKTDNTKGALNNAEVIRT